MKLDVGDYMTDPHGRVSVDRKQNMGEIENNFTWQRKRFEKECKRAKEQGIKLVFLIEHGKPIKSIDDVKDWENPRLNFAICRVWKANSFSDEDI